MSKPLFLFAFFILLAVVRPVMAGSRGPADLLPEVEQTLARDNLDAWFPRALDADRGGFRCNFDRDWQPSPFQSKTLVFQSRMTWTAADIVLRRPERAEEFRRYARHGVDFLSRLWDPILGGFFWSLDPAKKDPVPLKDTKHVYGNAFAIYALAAASEALDDKACKDRAIETFRWLERHAHDAQNRGYHESLARDGTPDPRPDFRAGAKMRDLIYTPLGCKSMNTHIHLLEAFTALYRIWPDATLRARLEELLDLMLNKVCVWPGAQHLFFTADWRPLPMGMSFGHDVETTYLLAEAAAALGRPDDPAVWSVGRALADHALAYGWDRKNGGFYDTGEALTGPTGRLHKIWWVQAEALNTLLLLHERYGAETDVYWQRFLEQWSFIRHFQTDSRYGGWYLAVNEDGSMIPGDDTIKGIEWKAAYHDTRALLNVSERLARLIHDSASAAGRR
jgi:mannobiose 2-epimerase